MRFSERMGIVPSRKIQLKDIDQNLRNRLINFHSETLYEEEAKYILDRLGLITLKIPEFHFSNAKTNVTLLLEYLAKCSWNEVYDVIQYKISCLAEKTVSDLKDGPSLMARNLVYQKKMNGIFEEENSGYRIINELVVPITNELELETIEKSMHTAFPAINIHLQKALELYSDRKNPDYENSIKESISAVESMTAIILGSDEKNVTLGRAIKKLKEKGIHIHQALEDAFSKLYGYASDEAGIRHGKIDFTNAPAEDAKFMLVSCSAFINYLVEKHEKNL